MKYKKPKNKSKHHIEPGLAYMKITIYSGSKPKNKGYAL